MPLLATFCCFRKLEQNNQIKLDEKYCPHTKFDNFLIFLAFFELFFGCSEFVIRLISLLLNVWMKIKIKKICEKLNLNRPRIN